MFKSVALAGMILAAAAPASAAELITNGSFEASPTSFTGWTVSGVVDLNTGASYGPCCGTYGSEPSYSGNQFAGLGGGNIAGDATLSQSFATLIGATYALSFDAGAVGGNYLQAIEVLALGDYAGGSFYSSGTLFTDAFFTHRSLSFVATDALTTLTFRVQATDTDNVDSLLDNVSVIGPAVPEPASWAMMVGGFALVGGALRRRSGLLAA